MAEEWIVRVEGKEYGPVDLDVLREWKREGRVLPTNEVRGVDVDLWTTAAKIPDLFGSPAIVEAEVEEEEDRVRTPLLSFGQILRQTWRIYCRGFFQFLCLTAIVAIPSLCGQLSGAAVGSPSPEMDARTLLAAMFNLAMLVLSVATWPFYIAGIQILTSELSGGRSIGVADLVQRALKFWPRVFLLWLFVCLSYFFWTVLPVFVIFMIVVGSQSLFAVFFSLLVLAFQIWMTGRLFVNFMFWQQFAVLESADFKDSLLKSREVARSRRDLPWFQRPLWRGVFLASLWFALVLLFSANQISSALTFYFQEVVKATDAQALLQAMSEHAKTAGFSWLDLGFWLVQKLLQPLLGIAFVLLYLDNKGRRI